jgi:hypothetical protein
MSNNAAPISEAIAPPPSRRRSAAGLALSLGRSWTMAGPPLSASHRSLCGWRVYGWAGPVSQFGWPLSMSRAILARRRGPLARGSFDAALSCSVSGLALYDGMQHPRHLLLQRAHVVDDPTRTVPRIQTEAMDRIYTADEVDDWTVAADVFVERALASFEPPVDVETIVRLWMTAWGYEAAPVNVLRMIARLVQAGYVLALADVAHGTYDSHLPSWRPGLFD